MKIAVCDDEKIFFNELNELFNQYSKEMQEQIYAVYFSTGRDLLSSKIKFDIIFMDYQMDDLNGMETCQILRTKKAFHRLYFKVLK